MTLLEQFLARMEEKGVTLTPVQRQFADISLTALEGDVVTMNFIRRHGTGKTFLFKELSEFLNTYEPPKEKKNE